MPADILTPDIFNSQFSRDTVPALDVLRREGWTRFNELPLPQRTLQQWRFSNLDHIKPEGFVLPSAPPSPDVRAALLARSPFIGGSAAAFVFADGYLIEEQAIDKDLQARGVIFEPLAVAALKHPDLLRQHLLKSGAALGGEKFLALHQAYLGSGYFLYVPDGVEVSRPVVIYNWLAGSNAAVFPHALIVAGDNARINVVDFYLSADPAGAGFSSAAADIHAGAGAGVSRTVVQDWGTQVRSYQVDATHAGRDSAVTSVSVNLGAHRARFENTIRINGVGANVRVYGLTVADGEQEFDQRTLQIHNAGGAYSDLLFKNALLDRARTIFSGLIRVAPDAQKTDAYQANRNLLLSPDAEANSLPGLEIGANDVRCSHGATTGQLDDEELFYLLARGIPKEKASELLVFGFFEEIIGKTDDSELAGILRDFVRAKFTRRTKGAEDVLF
ncbi:MAG: Fe-S cluster assembly protein SufD [Puniceicoccales bacterium]|jgi:Fe-S cluster assembly protein SufD|nr:Fe-S cluster assembly protein SufD [Puniceicoccales bacterium]